MGEGDTSALSASQRLIWNASQGANVDAYRVPLILEVEGAIEPGQLIDALGLLVARHEALRIVVANENGTPQQYIRDADQVTITSHTLSGRELFENFVTELLAQPMSLEKSCFNAHVVICQNAGGTNLYVVLDMHHLVCDGWSMQILADEFLALMEGRQLDPDPIQFIDWVEWSASRENNENDCEFWCQRAKTWGPESDLFAPSRRSIRVDTLTSSLPWNTWNQIEEYARHHHVSPFEFLVMIWAQILGKHTKADHLTLATPWSNRLDEETHSVVGCLVDTTLFRIPVDHDKDPHTLLDETKTTIRDCLGSSEPGYNVISRILLDNDVVPDSNLLIALQPPLPEIVGESLTLTALPTPSFFAKNDLTLRITPSAQIASDTGPMARIELELRKGIMTPSDGTDLIADFEMLLQNVINAPNQPISHWMQKSSWQGAKQKGTVSYRSSMTNDENRINQVLEIWQTFLMRPELHPDDNFFTEGGDSIQALRLVQHLRQTGVDCRPRDIFQYPTVRGLVLALSSETKSGPTTQNDGHETLNSDRDDHAPPLEPWFFDLELANKNHWLQAVCLEFKEPLKEKYLRSILDQLHAEHQIFGRRWNQDSAGNWYSHNIAVNTAYNLFCGNGAIPELPDIVHGPLSCLAYDPDQKQLTWTIHHLIVDTVSWMVLLEQLSALLSVPLTDAQVSAPVEMNVIHSAPEEMPEATRRPIRPPPQIAIDKALGCHNHNVPGERGIYGKQQSIDRTYAPSTGDAFETLLGQGFTREEILLSSLIAVMAGHTPEGTKLSLMLEHHGRSMDALGSQKTEIGWHTVMAPITVEISPKDPPTSVLMTTMEALATRQSSEVPVVGQGPSICFNYLGNVTAKRLDGFEVIPFPELALYDPDGVRPFSHEILVWENEEGLHWRWLCGPEMDTGEIEKWLAAIEEQCQFLANTVLSQSFVLPAGPLAESLVARQYDTGERNRYVEQALAFFQGGYDPVLITDTVGLLIQRHQALRSDFVRDSRDRIIHRVSSLNIGTDQNGLPIRFVDLSDRPENAATHFEELCHKDAMRGFSLDHAPLARFVIGDLGRGNWALGLIHHHAILDGWSLPILMKEAFQIMDGAGADLPAVSIQHPDLARARVARPSGGIKIADWRQKLSGLELDGRIELPSTGAQISTAEHDLEASLGEALTDRLEAIAADFGVTASSWLLAVFSIARHKMGWSPTTCFGVTTAGRSIVGQDLENFVGLAANTLPFVLPMSASETFAEYVHKVHDHSAFLQASVDFRLTELAALAGMTPDAMVESLFVFENYPVGELRGRQTALTDVRMTANAHIPLCLAIIPGNVFSFRLALRGGKIPRAVGQNFLDTFIFLTEQTTHHPDVFLHALATEKTLRLQHSLMLGRSPSFLHPTQSAFELLAESARRYGDQVALSADGNETTYAELYAQAKIVATALQECLPVPGQVVGVRLPRDTSLLTTFYGISGAGHACVIVDVELPALRQRAMLDAVRPALVVGTAEPPSGLYGTISFKALSGKCQAAPSFNIGAMPPQTLAYIVFTSGSTGTPKKVAVPVSAVANLGIGQAARMGLQTGDRVLQMASPVFDAFFSEVLMCVASGATLCLPDEGRGVTHGDPAAVLKRLAITHVTMPPSLLAILPVEKMPALRVILVAGERANAAQLKAALRAGKIILNAYGPCEATVCTTMGSLDKQVIEGIVPDLGQVIDGIDVFVLDRDERPAKDGQSGELAIAGSLAWGYLDDPRKTAECFRPHPWAKNQGERLYFTGDMAARDEDGNLVFQGRRDRQIKINGHRIELGEVERTVESLTAVKTAFADLIQEDDRKQLAVWIQSDGDQEVDLRRMHNELVEILPPAAVPRNWAIVKDWPRNPSGKIDRNALPIPTHLGSQVVVDAAQGQETGDPRHLSFVKKTWAEVIGSGEPSDHDDFLFAGGDSIKAIQLSARLSAFGIDVRARDLLTGITPLELAGRGAGLVEEPLSFPESSELAPTQRMLIERVGHVPKRWLLSTEVELDSSDNLDNIAAIISGVFERHPALSVTLSQDAALQHVRPGAPGSFVFCADAAQEPRMFFDGLRDMIDPFSGPNFVAGLSQVAGRTLLLLCGHHLILDVVSLRLLIDEINGALQHGPLIGQAPSFLDWSHRIVEDTKSGCFDAERHYWLEKLSAPCALGALFIGERPRESQAIRILRQLDISDQDRTASEWEAILMQAHADIIGGSDATDLVIECERHGRSYPSDFPSETVVGWLTASFPVRVHSGGTPHAVAKQIASVPSGGTGFLALLHISSATDMVLQGAFFERCRISFNFLGELPPDDETTSVGTNTGDVAPETRRLQYLSVEAWTSGCDLVVRWGFEPASWPAAEQSINEIMERTSQLAKVGWEKHDNLPEEIPDKEVQALMDILQAQSDE
jgi:amino acid adenylation domain-containing protein